MGDRINLPKRQERNLVVRVVRRPAQREHLRECEGGEFGLSSGGETGELQSESNFFIVSLVVARIYSISISISLSRLHQGKRRPSDKRLTWVKNPVPSTASAHGIRITVLIAVNTA